MAMGPFRDKGRFDMNICKDGAVVGAARIAGDGPTRALIYAPRDDAQRWVATCLDYAAKRHYDVVHIQVGGAEQHWPSLARWLIDGRTDVILTALPEHLPATRTPRVESVSEEGLIARTARRRLASRRSRRLSR